MYGILLKFETDNPEATRARAYEVKGDYEQIPGFVKIIFFNDIGNGGNTHGFLLQLETEAVADAFLEQIQNMDLSDIQPRNLSLAKFELLGA